LLEEIPETGLAQLREALHKAAATLAPKKRTRKREEPRESLNSEDEKQGDSSSAGESRKSAGIVFGRFVQGSGGEPFVALGLDLPAEIPESDRVRVFIDGASRGNPGPAAVGVVFEDPNGRRIAEGGARLGVMTNNAAEYHGLISALHQALDWGVGAVEVMTDSELLVRQMNGTYAVKSPLLAPLYRRAKSLRSKLEYCSIRHIPRAMNRRADELANLALDRAPAP
jgi:ribonuclease HI